MRTYVFKKKSIKYLIIHTNSLGYPFIRMIAESITSKDITHIMFLAREPYTIG